MQSDRCFCPHAPMVLFAVLLIGIECLVATAADGPYKAKVPDYRWVVEDQQIIVRQKDLGLEEDVSVYPEGLTFAKNGDLLMAACVNSGIGMAVRKPAAGKTFIMRSSDRGKTWREQGVLEHKADAGYDPRDGAVEGM